MATQLSIYNDVLTNPSIGSRALATVTDDVPDRYILDDIWASASITSSPLARCLARGQWNWAARVARYQVADAATPSFGWTYQFTPPTDFVRTICFSTDERCQTPLGAYESRGGVWLTDTAPVYVKYVSNHASYGSNLAIWPAKFAAYVAAHMALYAGARIRDSVDIKALQKGEEAALLDAQALDAMENPTQGVPQGRWVSARRYGGGMTTDRGTPTIPH
jgi:hypothetical protein